MPRAPALRCPHGPVPRGPFKGGGGVSRRPGRPVKGPARGARRTRAGAAGPEGPRPQDVHADARPQQAGHAAPHRYRGRGVKGGAGAWAPAPSRSAPPVRPDAPPLPAGPTQQAVESSKLGELRGRLQPGAWPPAR